MNSNIGYTTEMIGGMPVIVAPAEIDIATADDLGQLCWPRQPTGIP